MDSPDQSFIQAFGPIHVPHRYEDSASVQDNVVYALAQLEQATAKQVAKKLTELNPKIEYAIHLQQAEDILSNLFATGRIKGDDNETSRQYNLSKILTQNSGKADGLY